MRTKRKKQLESPQRCDGQARCLGITLFVGAFIVAMVPVASWGQTILDLGGGVTMEFELLPAGTLMMGTESTDASNLIHARPVHQVTISQPFYIGKYEVTQVQWNAVMDNNNNNNNPSAFRNAPDSLDRPVEMVSWDSAIDFTQALSSRSGEEIRLPSEAEWEYAARAGTSTEYYFGNDAFQLDDYAWWNGNSGGETHPVGEKLPNPWGLFDMGGNVWEFCRDPWHHNYDGAPTDGSPWLDGGNPIAPIVRGSGWCDDIPGVVAGRSALRGWGGVDIGNSCVGFRVVMIRNNHPPIITCNGPIVLWSPDHDLADAGSAFNVSDPDGGPVTLSFRIFSDESEMPETGDGTGRHAPDFKTQLASGAQGLFVRSERRGPENGRFYILVVTADDTNGGATTAVCIAAVVPHDQDQPSLDDVMAQATAAAADVETVVNANTLPAPGEHLPSPIDNLYEHGLSAPLGPKQ